MLYCMWRGEGAEGHRTLKISKHKNKREVSRTEVKGHASKSRLCSIRVEGKSFNPLGPMFPHLKLETICFSPRGVIERKWNNTQKTIQNDLRTASSLGVVKYFYGHWSLVVFSFIKSAEFIFPYQGPICLWKLLHLNLLDLIFWDFLIGFL